MKETANTNGAAYLAPAQGMNINSKKIVYLLDINALTRAKCFELWSR